MTTYSFNLVGGSGLTGDNLLEFREVGTAEDNHGTYLANVKVTRILDDEDTDNPNADENQDLYWAGILVDIGKRPFITIGFAALLMLIPLAVTSTNGMMRRLGRRWKTLHRLAYVIVLLGIWHYYWQVKADVREPLVYLSIAVVLLGWRVWKQRRARWRLAANQTRTPSPQ